MSIASYFDPFPIQESDRLLFREFTLEDAKDIYQIRSNEEVMLYMDTAFHNDITDSQKFVQSKLDAYQRKSGISWAIIEKESGVFVGDLAFWRLDWRNFRAEIGYTLKPNYWGKGYMTEAMQTLFQFGFEKLSLHSFEANINPKNEASRKVLTKLGFRKEAYFRENYFYDGRFLDSEIYSLLEKGFKQLNGY